MRIFKLKAFARFQRKERISDTALAAVVFNADNGFLDADLGGGLIKQRFSRAGQGKSGGYRTVIAFRRGERAVFLFGFAKNERKNIGVEDLEELKYLAREYLEMKTDQIDAMIEQDEFIEVNYDPQN